MNIESAREDRNSDRNPDRLDSWKRIARYLQRGVRTVRRWEAEEQMPVHRHAHKTQGSVFAYRSELDDWLRGRSPPAKKKAAAPPQSLVAVLPFQNLSGDPDHEFLADGFTEELIGQLGELPRSQLGVIARTSAMLYKNASKSIDEIAGELGVDYIFEGSIRIHGERARITGQLIQTGDQTHIWSRHYERDLDDILSLQSGIAREIAAELSERLIEGRQSTPARADTRPTPKIDRQAFETYLMARSLLYRMTGESIERSITCFQNVIDAEPGFAPAYAGLAEALQLATIWVPLPPRQTMARAFEAITRAVAIDPDSAEAYAVLGFIQYSYSWDWAAAETAFERAIRINPNLAVAHQWYAEFLSALGRFDEAVDRIETAERLDPLSLAVATIRAHVFWLARRPDEMLATMYKAIEVEPGYPLAHIFVILGHAMKGDFAKSMQSVERAIETCGESYHFVGLMGAIAGEAGHPEISERALQKLQRLAEKQYVPKAIFAGPYGGLGDVEGTLDALEAAFEEREWHIPTLATTFMADPLRGHPRFQRLIERAGLADVDARLNG